MRNYVLASVMFVVCGAVQAQLEVSSHGLVGGYTATAFSGSDSGTFDVADPNGYLRVIREATLGDATGLLSANAFGVIESGPIENDLSGGFRMAGFVVTDVPTQPFYDFRHSLFSRVTFDLAEPTEIRITGTLRSDSVVDTFDFVPNNGTLFELNEAAGPTRFFASVAPLDARPVMEIDTTILLPAGTYDASLESRSVVGPPLSPGLLNADTSWDLSITVVPASATLAVAPLGLLALRRRR